MDVLLKAVEIKLKEIENEVKRPKIFRFCSAVLVHETYSKEEYDRRKWSKSRDVSFNEEA
jgi:hypothetical protein